MSSSVVTTTGRYTVYDNTNQVLRSIELPQFGSLGIVENVEGSIVQANISLDFATGPSVSGGVEGSAELGVHVLGQTVGGTGGFVSGMSNVGIRTGGAVVVAGFLAEGDSLLVDLGFSFYAYGIGGYSFGSEVYLHELITTAGSFQRSLAIPLNEGLLFPPPMEPGNYAGFQIGSRITKQLYFYSNYGAGDSNQRSSEASSALASGGSYAEVTTEGIPLEIFEVPEPSTFLLMVTAMMALGLSWYRSRSPSQ